VNFSVTLKKKLEVYLKCHDILMVIFFVKQPKIKNKQRVPIITGWLAAVTVRNSERQGDATILEWTNEKQERRR
jgi:hypothetical protein